VGFCFGGFLAVYPSVAADFYGTKNMGMNYGLLYLAYGAAAFVGPVFTKFMSLEQAFIAAAVISAVAAVGAFTLKHPIHPVDKQLKKI